jgi:RNA polymerase sigma factor (sigma-70 family)
MTTEPTLFVVDDDPSVCESLRYLGESVGMPVETFTDPHAFLDVYDPDRPGCLVLDLLMPGMDGLELQEKLKRRGAPLPIIFLSAHGDVPAAMRAVHGGALEFLEKAADPEELLRCVRNAFNRSRALQAQLARRRQLDTLMAKLTRREREVVDLVAAGKSNKLVANELGISEKTVEAHRGRAMSKLRLSSLAALVKLTVEYRNLCLATPLPLSEEGH